MPQSEAMNSAGFGCCRGDPLVDIGNRAHASLHQSDRSLNEPSRKGARGEVRHDKKKSEWKNMFHDLWMKYTIELGVA